MPSVELTLAMSKLLDIALSRPLRGPQMPSTDFAAVTRRLRAVREAQTTRCRAQDAKLTELEKRGDIALEKMDAQIKDHERDIAALENEVNQVSNGGPA